MTRRVSTSWSAALLLLAGSAFGAAHAQPDALSFGVVPQQSASQLVRSWTPVLAYLSGSSGLDIRFRTAPDIPEFERRLAAGEYDFAYMNPYHYTVFSRTPGYRALAKAADKSIKGILVVRAESPIQSLAELDGAELAFPAPAAFAASMLIRAHLQREGIDFTPTYVSSHDSVYLTVARGLYPAGGGVMRTLNNLDASTRSQLRVLFTTEGYTPHSFAAHPRVPAELVQRLSAAMQSMSEEPEGRELLAGLGLVGLEAAQDADWDDVRALDLDLLDGLIAPQQ